MKSLFIKPSDFSSRISDKPLVVFKYLLAGLSLYQAFLWFLDRNAIFFDNGLFPDQLLKSFYPNGLYSFGESYGVLLIGLQALIAIIAVLSMRSQNVAFFFLFLIEAFLRKRNFFFTNAGDSLLGALCLFAALTPAVKWKKNDHSKIKVGDLLALYILYSIIYFQNFYFKLQSRWITGEGLRDTLRHQELARLAMDSFANSRAAVILNHIALLLVLVSAFSPWIHPRHRKLKYVFWASTVAYHVGANALMDLSWLSVPFLSLQILLWGKIETSEPVPENNYSWSWRNVIGLCLCLLGFWGVRRADELAAFADHANIVFVHNWNMFAPPPPLTGRWEAIVKGPNGSTLKVDEEGIKKILSLRDSQHEYKYLYNLRRTEAFPVRRQLQKFLCEKIGKSGDEVQLNYQAHFFESDESRTIAFAPRPCN